MKGIIKRNGTLEGGGGGEGTGAVFPTLHYPAPRLTTPIAASHAVLSEILLALDKHSRKYVWIELLKAASVQYCCLRGRSAV
jgi:hypothetical protein